MLRVRTRLPLDDIYMALQSTMVGWAEAWRPCCSNLLIASWPSSDGWTAASRGPLLLD